MQQPTHLGAHRDHHDERDLAYQPPSRFEPPASADLSGLVHRVYDQQPPMRSCSAHAIAAAIGVLDAKAQRAPRDPSRLFLYYNARKREGTAGSDEGATIRNAIKASSKPGACSEATWPYEPANVTLEPPSRAYDNIVVRAVQYLRMTHDLASMRACLAEGFPFVFGMEAYFEPFVRAQTSGHLDLPATGDTAMGGHALLAVGYDDASQNLIALNSLGTSWGKAGFFTLPYAYLERDDLTYDFWTIRELA